MPVEIKELVIRAIVEDGAEVHRPERPASPGGLDANDRRALVEAAVREVLRILKATKER